MNNINKYYEATQKDKPRKNIKYFIDNIKINPKSQVVDKEMIQYS